MRDFESWVSNLNSLPEEVARHHVSLRDMSEEDLKFLAQHIRHRDLYDELNKKKQKE